MQHWSPSMAPPAIAVFEGQRCLEWRRFHRRFSGGVRSHAFNPCVSPSYTRLRLCSLFAALQVEEGVTMWSFTCWREGDIERNPELRAGRALKELEGWPEEVWNMVPPPSKSSRRGLYPVSNTPVE